MLLNAYELLFNVIENADQYFRPILNSYIRCARLEENKSNQKQQKHTKNEIHIRNFVHRRAISRLGELGGFRSFRKIKQRLGVYARDIASNAGRRVLLDQSRSHPNGQHGLRD